MAQPTAPALTGQDIGEAEGALRALLDEILAGTGTTSTEYIALRVLALRGPWDPPAALHDFLAAQRQLRLDPPAVTGLLDGLAARGLVRGVARDGTAPAELTPSGAALHTSLTSAITETTGRLYGDFAPGELATVHRVLAELVERANKLRGELGTNR